jgi:uncharacterized DUF497 family protein
MDLQFEWDPRKALLNEKKHGVSFNEAGTVFSDRQLLIMTDLAHSDDHDRFVAIGLSARGRLLLVVAKDVDDDQLRLISARRVTSAERTSYEQR